MKIFRRALWLLLACSSNHVLADFVHLVPTDDAMIRGGSTFADANYGTSKLMLVKQRKPSVNNEALTRKAVLKFDLSGVPIFNSAILTLYRTSSFQSGSVVRLCPLSDTSWDEVTVTYNNVPPYDEGNVLGECVGDVAVSSTEDKLEWDITSYLQTTTATSIVSFVIDGTPVVDKSVNLYSKETDQVSQRPKLALYYSTGTPVPGTDAPITSFPSKAPVTDAPTPASPSSLNPATDAPVTASPASPSVALVTPAPVITATVTLDPTDDTMIRGGPLMAHINFGDTTTMLVKAKKPNLTNEDLAGAIARLCAVSDTSSWEEDTLTYDTAPSYGATCLGNQTLAAVGDYITWDVTTYLQSPGDVAFVIDGEPAVDKYFSFKTKEAPNVLEHPQLIITSGPAPPTAAPITTTTTSPSLTPVASSVSPTSAPSGSVMPTTASSPQCSNAVEDTWLRETRSDEPWGATDYRLDTKFISGDARYAYLKFDTSQVTTTVGSAVLRLFGYTQGSSVLSAIYPLSGNNWSPAVTTFDNPQVIPILGPPLATGSSPTVRGVSIDFDITAHVNANIEDTELSLGVYAESGTNVYKYYSMDAANANVRPLLVIDGITSCTAGPIPLVPNDLVKFQPLLQESRLQWPESSPTAVGAGAFDAYFSDGFQLASIDQELVQMEIDQSDGRRCELRNNAEWSAADIGKERKMYANMTIPAQDLVNTFFFTFLQIHTKDFAGNPSGPLFRVIWRGSRDGLTDYLWANIRTSLDPKVNAWVPLVPRPTGFFEISVSVEESKLSVLIDRRHPNPIFHKFDLSYWHPISTNYFKAGPYYNSGTLSSVITLYFDELQFLENDQPF